MRAKAIKVGFLFLAASLLAYPDMSSANAWEKFYREWHDSPAKTIPYAGAPEVIDLSQNHNDTIKALWSRGYTIVGYSDFTGFADMSGASKVAKKLGARFVAIRTEIDGSSGPISISNSNGSVGSGSYSGMTTTTELRRIHYAAAYFQEVAKHGTGLLTRLPTDEESQRIGTQKAFVVIAVRNGSPAFESDVVPGDIIVKIDGQPATNEIAAAANVRGSPIPIHIIRGTREMDVTLTAPRDWN